MLSKAIVSLLIVVASWSTVSGKTLIQAKRSCYGTCQLQFRCDPYFNGPVTWAIVDDRCKPFKTDCIFSSLNCQRQNECLPKVQRITKEACQPFCIGSCSGLPSSPLCASYGYISAAGERQEELVTYQNECELERSDCVNGKAHYYTTEGPCA